MISTIKTFNGFDIDVFRRTSNQYILVWPGGNIAILDRESTKLLAAELVDAVRWKGRTVSEYQDEFFQFNRNDLTRTIY